MKREQAVRFWRELEATTSAQDVVNKYNNKTGYGGKRTLDRLVQAHRSFSQGVAVEGVSSKTGWSLGYVTQMQSWWRSTFEDQRREPEQGDWRQQVRLQKGLEHVAKLQEEASSLSSQVVVPEAVWLGSWIPPWADLFGVSALGTRDAELRPLAIHWEPRPDDPGQLRLTAEDDLYYDPLQRHIPDSAVWDGLQRWKAELARLLWKCRNLMTEIVVTAECETGEKVRPSQDWAKPGLYWDFPRRVYVDLLLRAEGRHGGGSQWQLESRAQGWVLRYGGRGMAVHLEQGVLTGWEKTLKAMCGDQDWQTRATDLVQQQRHLCGEAEPIREPLSIEIGRGSFGGGTCALCP